MRDAYEVRKAAEVMDDTWGHLKPKHDITYEGYILYAIGTYGDIVCLATCFRDLEDSPWFYEDLHEFMGSSNSDGENETIYLFTGTYCRNRDPKFLDASKRVTADSLRLQMGK